MSSSSSRCFSRAYGYSALEIALYACTVIFLVVHLGILVALFIVRKRVGPGRHLIGLPFILAVVFKFIQLLSAFLMSTLGACRVFKDVRIWYGWSTAEHVFYVIHSFLLAVVVIYTLNTMLRKQLGHDPSTLRKVLGPVLFILGSLLLVMLVMQSYLYYHYGRMSGYNAITFDPMILSYISLAFDGTFLISILSSGALSIIAARSIKKRHGTTNSLTVWISVLILAIVGFTIIFIIQVASSISLDFYNTIAGFVVMAYFAAIFYAVAFIAIIMIAKDSAWTSVASTANTRAHQQEDLVYGRMGQRV